MAASAREMDREIRNKICKTLGIAALKRYQVEALEAICLKKRDTLVCVPTGSGKSACFEGISTLLDWVYATATGTDSHTDSTTTTSDRPSNTVTDGNTEPSIVLVVSPLVSLMKKQVARLKDLGLEALELSTPSGDETLQNMKDGKYR